MQNNDRIEESKQDTQMKKVQTAMYQGMLKTMADKLYSRGKQGLCKEVGCENKRANGSSRCGECSNKFKRDKHCANVIKSGMTTNYVN